MTLGLLATIMVTLLLVTVGAAIWRCSHPYRMRYRRCAGRRRRGGICKELQRH
ncbi:hypothetical protein AB4Z48_02300 [Cupriavidus sp. 2TAF22]|uniref:hypothetical protein n=1 Tax=unclassified Cupriavidus TaxID=2640874 RepID=UPI003F92D30B